jgi:hypothetical protein
VLAQLLAIHSFILIGRQPAEERPRDLSDVLNGGCLLNGVGSAPPLFDGHRR